MKRWRCLIAVLLAAFLLTGCTDLFTTKDYRLYKSFVSRHEPGMDKQTVLNKLGCPKYYLDSQGKYQYIPYGERDAYEEILLEDGSLAWGYECYELPDPANPYRLTITFDASGKTVSAELTPIPGG